MLAKEIMTRPVVSIESHKPVRNAIEAMNAHDIRHLPVVDGAKVLGVLSQRDIASISAVISFFDLGRDSYDTYVDQPVGNLLKTRFESEGGLVTVEPYDTVERVASRMVEHKLSAIPVVNDHGVIGMISYIDILHSLNINFENVPTLA